MNSTKVIEESLSVSKALNTCSEILLKQEFKESLLFDYTNPRVSLGIFGRRFPITVSKDFLDTSPEGWSSFHCSHILIRSSLDMELVVMKSSRTELDSLGSFDSEAPMSIFRFMHFEQIQDFLYQYIKFEVMLKSVWKFWKVDKSSHRPWTAGHERWKLIRSLVACSLDDDKREEEEMTLLVSMISIKHRIELIQLLRLSSGKCVGLCWRRVIV